MAEKLAQVICPDEECAMELKEILRAYNEIEKSIVDVRFKPRFIKDGPVYLENLENVDELLALALNVLGRNGIEIDCSRATPEALKEGFPQDPKLALLSYVARRILYKSLVGRVEGIEWSGGRCPVCGLVPSAAVYSERQGWIYSQTALVLACLCGYSWEYESFKCPACGASSRENFDVYIQGQVVYYKCRKCGHILGTVRTSGESFEKELPVAINYGVVRLVLSGALASKDVY
ncbi:hypothetical protein IG193_00165 [Infirmifilum lucidum]|uniref:Formate dehydrogenase accessory protein FdhE n=1 Tax=Infirmifilum lucidum TaxID=2776706 RepID=A0A7L9FGS2_9CREN|nr:hypothetical protein [Infirmifilum lucidum]QOJ78917.1 hypothetical protein IG193_00165 [Infirmifilum lucidum]